MQKKNFLFVSLTGLISDIAWQVPKMGHEVRYFIGDKKEHDICASGDSPVTVIPSLCLYRRLGVSLAALSRYSRSA
jgi:hypothetical protein